MRCGVSLLVPWRHCAPEVACASATALAEVRRSRGRYDGAMSSVQINGDQGGHTRSATVPPGTLVFTAGAAPIDADGQTVHPGDVSRQARQCMINLQAALEEAGTGLGDVAKVTVFVAERLQVDLVVAWDAVTEAFGDHKPAGSLLGVSVLAYDDQLVEIEAVAVVPAS